MRSPIDRVSWNDFCGYPLAAHTLQERVYLIHRIIGIEIAEGVIRCTHHLHPDTSTIHPWR